MRRFSHHSVVLPFLAIALYSSSRPAHAQIVTDGSLGAALHLNGPDYQIGSNLGKIFGKNLFHSFQDFNLSAGESATFSGPSSIANILSRVTGGNPSSIDGSINSTIPGANFFFINPSGIVFGPNSQVNVGGSFVATTADVVNLKDGGSFNALNPSATLLTSAAPAAFGFLTPQPAPILLSGSFLSVSPGKAFSLIGGDISASGAFVAVPQGKLNLVSVASAGQVNLDATNPTSNPTLTGFNKLGTIIMDGSAVDVGDDPSGPTGTKGGSATIRAENLIMDNGSQINTINTGATSGGHLDIQLQGDLQLHNDSSIAATNDGSGTGPDISVKAATIFLEGSTSAFTQTGIESVVSNNGTGQGGNLKIEGNTLIILRGASISSNTTGPGNGGAVTIQARDVDMDSEGSSSLTGISAQTLDSGNGGTITLNARNLNITNGAEISGSTGGTGLGGQIQITADQIKLDGQNSPLLTGIAAGSYPLRSSQGGDSGQILITAKSLEIVHGAEINGDTFGTGKGATISIKTDSLAIDRQGSQDHTGIRAATLFTAGGGQGGSISVQAKDLKISGGGEISTLTDGSGPGGSIQIVADKITLDGTNSPPSVDTPGTTELTGIAANTSSEGKTGQGGSISIESKNLHIVNGATVTAFTSGGSDGGKIEVNSDTINLDGGNLPHFTGFSTQTAAQFRGGKGGTITLNAKSLKIANGSEISSSTFGEGNGGNIILNADGITIDNQDAFSFTGIAAGTFGQLGKAGQGGKILLNAKNLHIINGGSILADTTGTGQGGDITIRANQTLLDGQNFHFGTGIAADTKSTREHGGQGGGILIETKDLKVIRGATISAGTLGEGQSGSIEIHADTITLDREGSDQATALAAETGGSGDGGEIYIQTKSLNLRGGAEITANTFGSGQGGPIIIIAKDVIVDGTGSGSNTVTAITAGTKPAVNGGNGGDIFIDTDRLKVVNEGIISTSTLGSGQGGTIEVETGDLLLNKGAITAEARATGNGGSVTLNSRGSASFLNQSSVLASSEQSNGGNVAVTAKGSIFVTDSALNAQAAGNGGSVTLDAGRLVQVKNGLISARAGGDGGNLTSNARVIILDRSSVVANAIQGKGGNILFKSRVFLPSIESIIDASSQFGVDGNVAIESPNTNLGGSLITLPSNLLSAENYLAPRCEIRISGTTSSFTVNPQNGNPTQPGDLLPSPTTK